MKNKLLILMSFIIIATSISAQMLLPEETVVLKTSAGDIFGSLKVPANNKPIPLVLIIAGSGSTDRNCNQPNMKSNSYKMLADILFDSGVASLRYDKRMIGQSKVNQKEEELRFEYYVEDAKAWIEQLSKDKRFLNIVVIGHSEGSLIGMLACQNNTKVSKYISVAGVGTKAGDILKEQLTKQLGGQPETVKNQIFDYINKLEQGETVKDVPASLYTLFRPSVQPYMISWFRYNPQKEIAKLRIPVLILQGTTDLQVSVKQAELLSIANPKSKKVILENMDHVMKSSISTEMVQQLKNSYNNPSSPLHRELAKIIVDFIQ